MKAKIPQTFQVKVLERYMNDKEIESFFENYRAHLKKQGGRYIMEPTAKDIAITRHLRKVKSYAQASAELGVSSYAIMSAVGRVSAWEK